tara:strand:- start:289 stop:417 length:129 start_codon:yes stop_codon:yes gene_type:complete
MIAQQIYGTENNLKINQQMFFIVKKIAYLSSILIITNKVKTK